MKKTPLLLMAAAFMLFACSGLTDTPELAESFFKAVKEGDYDKASTFLSEEFKANTNTEQLKAFMEKSAMSNFESASWNSRKVENGVATLEGKITTADGGIIPVTMKFVKENEKWMILSLSREEAGVDMEEEEKTAAIPPDYILEDIVTHSVEKFATAVKFEDFTDFHNSISETWQEQITPEELKKIFNDFIVKKVDIRAVDEVKPKFTRETYIDKDGLMRVQGYFPTHPKVVNFKLTYIFEEEFWKLFGIEINFKEEIDA